MTVNEDFIKNNAYIPVGTGKQDKTSDTLYNRIMSKLSKKHQLTPKTLYNQIKNFKDNLSPSEKQELKDDFIPGPQQKLYVSPRVADALENYYLTKYNQEDASAEIINKDYVRSRLAYAHNIFKNLIDENPELSQEDKNRLNKVQNRYENDLEQLLSISNRLDNITANLEDKIPSYALYNYIKNLPKE